MRRRADTNRAYDANDKVTLTGVVTSHLTASDFKFTRYERASLVGLRQNP
jgi:hypothetical protein